MSVVRNRGTAALALVLLLSAGCGSKSKVNGTLGAIQLISNAAKTTTSARTSRVSMDAQIESGDGAQTTSVHLVGTGGVDFQAHQGSMDMTLSKGAEQLAIQMVFDGTVVYEKLPPQSSGLPAGKPWIKLDLEALSKQSGVDVAQLEQSTPTDPSQSLQYLLGVSKDVHVVGQDSVRGTSTTHYRVSIDLNALADKGSVSKDAIRRLSQLQGGAQIPADVWIDAQGRVRRMRLSLNLPGSASSTVAGGTMTETIEYYDFGVPVNVTLPPASEVTDLSDLIKASPSP